MAIDDSIHDKGDLRGWTTVELEFQQVADLSPVVDHSSWEIGICVGHTAYDNVENPIIPYGDG